MLGILIDSRESAFFLLACDHDTACANTPEALRRYRWEDSDPEGLTWPPTSSVVEIRDIGERGLRDADRRATLVATSQGTRPTALGERLAASARQAAVSAMKAEEIAAKAEKRLPDPNAFARGLASFESGLPAADYHAYLAQRAYRDLRAQEICRLAIVRLLVDVASQLDLRQVVAASVAERPALAKVISPADFGDTFPVEKVGGLVTRWLLSSRDAHAGAAAQSLKDAEATLIQAIAEEATAGDVEAARKQAEEHLVNLAGAPAMEDGAILKALRTLKAAAERAVWRGAGSAQDIWNEVADHTERLVLTGKGGSSSSSQPGRA